MVYPIAEFGLGALVGGHLRNGTGREIDLGIEKKNADVKFKVANVIISICVPGLSYCFAAAVVF